VMATVVLFGAMTTLRSKWLRPRKSGQKYVYRRISARFTLFFAGLSLY